MRYILLIAVAMLSACKDVPAPKARPTLPTEVLTQVKKVGANELVIVDIPSAGDVQRCFVWRDNEYKTASMQCPTDTPMEMPITSTEEPYQR